MHDGQVGTDLVLVRRLLEGQFPSWSGLPLRRVDSHGTDHDVYRLGDDLAVRLPIVAWAQSQAEVEARWLPAFAPKLPLSVPAPVALGEPARGYPFTWSVVAWLPGESADRAAVDLTKAAIDLAAFVRALRELPVEGAHQRRRGARGSPLSERDEDFRSALDQLGDRLGPEAPRRDLLSLWEGSLEAAVHSGPETWVHGDLLPGNLLAEDGVLTSVIDFGGLNVGDPACDLQPAWSLLDRRSRELFRDELQADDDAWLRGRGWSLAQAVIALPYYWDTNPGIVRQARRSIAAVLEG
jgi:aminoglycoside phosphotransferase (APT) family kinase protein